MIYGTITLLAFTWLAFDLYYRNRKPAAQQSTESNLTTTEYPKHLTITIDNGVSVDRRHSTIEELDEYKSYVCLDYECRPDRTYYVFRQHHCFWFVLETMPTIPTSLIVDWLDAQLRRRLPFKNVFEYGERIVLEEHKTIPMPLMYHDTPKIWVVEHALSDRTEAVILKANPCLHDSSSEKK